MRVALPEGADPVQVAGGLNPGLASWMPLVARADDGPLGCVLVVGATGVADIMAQLPGYLRLIADGTVTVPTRSFPLSRVTEAWATAADGGDRVVIVPDTNPS